MWIYLRRKKGNTSCKGLLFYVPVLFVKADGEGTGICNDEHEQVETIAQIQDMRMAHLWRHTTGWPLMK